ncbi:MAG: L,D-transpeptidase family protein [Bernardetiaceae bacterium]|nr:L,D-transpeptidase family protein [Bernardetiaceae bacterium]
MIYKTWTAVGLVAVWSITACEPAAVTNATQIPATTPEVSSSTLPVADCAHVLRLAVKPQHDTVLTQSDSLLFIKDSSVNMFYRKRNFKPLWDSVEKIDQAVNTLLHADTHGLVAVDYAIERILQLRQVAMREEYQNPHTLAKLEIALTTGLLRYATHLLAGKLVPTQLHPLWNYPSRAFVHQHRIELLEKYVAADSVATVFQHIRRHPHYVFLQNQLAAYKKMAAAGVFQPLQCDTTIRKGGLHPAIIRLRKRLFAEKIDADSSANPVLDDSLSKALQIWQYRHGLKQTGVLDTATRNALNVPVEQRIATIRANMERMRWLPDTLPADFILVNIADFRLFLFRNGEVVWETPVTVGTRVNRTPVFQTYISHLELNPTWNVPHSIVTKEIAVEAAKRSDYITRNRFQIIDKNGMLIEPSTINWSEVRSGKKVYHFYQPPGAGNQLGKIKFYCVNPHAIYLHDTPSLSKFKLQERAFSHGCVRVWKPFELAGLLMGDTTRWNQAAFDQLLAPGITRSVILPRREPVHIHYFTAFPDRTGQLILRRDIYGHDRQLLQLLDLPLQSMQ